MKKNVGLAFIVFMLVSFVCSRFHKNSEIAQWRGPNRDGIFPETNPLSKQVAVLQEHIVLNPATVKIGGSLDAHVVAYSHGVLITARHPNRSLDPASPANHHIPFDDVSIQDLCFLPDHHALMRQCTQLSRSPNPDTRSQLDVPVQSRLAPELNSGTQVYSTAHIDPLTEK